MESAGVVLVEVASLVEVEADMLENADQACVKQHQACLFPMLNLYLDCLIAVKVDEKMAEYALAVAD